MKGGRAEPDAGLLWTSFILGSYREHRAFTYAKLSSSTVPWLWRKLTNV